MGGYCENCGAEIRDNAQFCSECGTKITDNDIETPKICPNCGNNIEDDGDFCENCGTNINAPQTMKKENFLQKYKIPIIIIAVVVIVAVIIAATLSFTAKPADVGTRIVSVGINDFIIPGDYKIDPSSIDVDYTGYNAVFSQAYSNGEEIIGITVMNIPPRVNGEEVAASQGGVHKNLMGVTGYYTEDNGYYTFAFVDGAYLNVVTVSSPYVFDQITYKG